MKRLSRRALTGTAAVAALAAGALTVPAASAETATIVSSNITATTPSTTAWYVEAKDAPGTRGEISSVDEPYGQDGSIQLVTGTPATAGAQFSAFLMHGTSTAVKDLGRFDFLMNGGVVGRLDIDCDGKGSKVTLLSSGGGTTLDSTWTSTDAFNDAGWNSDVFVEPDGTTSTTATGATKEIHPGDDFKWPAYAEACQAGTVTAYGVGLQSASGPDARVNADQIRFNGEVWDFGRDAAAAAGVPQSVVRAAGKDRIATAIQVSQFGWNPAEAGGVVLARSDDFADGLAGATLAAKVDGPVLISRPDGLRADVLTEIKRVLPKGKTVYLLGGTGALQAPVATAVANAGYIVKRLYGANRYETAVKVADAVDATPSDIFVTTGSDFADALSAGAAAGANGGVLVLTNGAALPSATEQYLNTHATDTTALWAIGGPAATALGGNVTDSFVGANRYATAVEVADYFFDYVGYNSGAVVLASGEDFPDALGAGAVGARFSNPVLLTPKSSLRPEVATFLKDKAQYVGFGIAAGGPGAVTDGVLSAAKTAIAAK